MSRAGKLREANNEIWLKTMDFIDELLEALYDTNLSEHNIKAYSIIDDFDAGHVGVFYITKVDKQKTLYGTLDEDEEEIPFDMMTNESLIQLAESLEEYVEQYLNWG